MRKLTLILIGIIGTINVSAQSNLDFEKWNVSYNGVDAAKNWTNTSDATKLNAPTTLFKVVENPASGLASLKLTTAYWQDGAAFELDTLVGSLLQETSYTERPKSFEFSYKCNPVLGDEILVGVQLTKTVNHKTIVIGEGFFTSDKVEDNWAQQKVEIKYFSTETPNNISLIAMSSANAVITNGKNGYAKIGSTLYLDNFKLRTTEKIESLASEYYIHVFPNPAKSFINVETNSPEQQQLEIYNLSSKLLLATSFTEKSKIDISKLPSGTYVYTVFGVVSKKTTATNIFNVVR